jgi:putative addiction module component (TIGR02574 family)
MNRDHSSDSPSEKARASRLGRSYNPIVTDAAKKLLDQALQLSTDERAKLVTELLASLDGEPEEGWDVAWLKELDRRVQVAEERGESGSDWRSVRERILARLGA